MKESEKNSYFEAVLDRQEDDGFRQKLMDAYSRKNHLEEQKSQQETTIKGLELELKQLSQKKQRLEKTWEVLRQLLDRFSAENIDKLAELLNKGVKSIFTDRVYDVKLEITDTKQKRLDLIVVETKEDGRQIENNLSDSSTILLSGGGLLTVVSFIFRVYLIIHYEKRRFVVVDEAFSHISSLYIENFFTFLQYLIDEMGFTFMCVNHDVRFEPYFGRTYQVTDGQVRLMNQTSKDYETRDGRENSTEADE